MSIIVTPELRERLPFSNRYVFAKVMMDNPSLCKRLLELVLGIEIHRIEQIAVEHEETSITAKSVRYDVYLNDGDSYFVLELQASHEPALAQRMRFYLSKLDVRNLGHGDSYSKLPRTYIVFVCKRNGFASDQPILTFVPTALEDPDVKLETAGTFVVVNTHGKVPEENFELQALFSYLNDNVVTEGTLCGDLQDAVDVALRDDDDWRNAVLSIEQDIEAQKEGVRIEAFREGRKEGIAEGIVEGVAAEQARTEALAKALVEEGRESDIVRMSLEPEYKNQLLEEFGIE